MTNNNLVLNGKSIDSFSEIEDNYVEEELLNAYRSGLLVAWLKANLENTMVEAVGKIKDTGNVAPKIIKALGLNGKACKASQERIMKEREEEAKKSTKQDRRRQEAKTKANRDDKRNKKSTEDNALKEDLSETTCCTNRSIVDLMDAAKAGNVFAMKSLAKKFRNGDGVEQNLDEAVKWEQMAESARRNAECAEMEMEESKEVAEADINEDINTAAADEVSNPYATIDSIKQYADAGDAEAQYLLGNCYETGNGIRKNAKQAMKWYKAAAKQNHPLALYNAGEGYLRNYGLDYADDDADYNDDCAARLREAIRLLNKASKLGITEADALIAEAKQELRDYRKAERDWQRAVQANQLRREIDSDFAAKQDLENGDYLGWAWNRAKSFFS